MALFRQQVTSFLFYLSLYLPISFSVWKVKALPVNPAAFEACFLIQEESAFFMCCHSWKALLRGSLLLLLSSSETLWTSPPNWTFCICSASLTSQEFIFGVHLLSWPHTTILYGLVSFHFHHVDVSCLDLFSDLTLISNSLMSYYYITILYLDVANNPLLSIKVGDEVFLLVKQDYKHQEVATQHNRVTATGILLSFLIQQNILWWLCSWSVVLNIAQLVLKGKPRYLCVKHLSLSSVLGERYFSYPVTLRAYSWYNPSACWGRSLFEDTVGWLRWCWEMNFCLFIAS